MISVIGTNDEVNGKEVMKMDARSRSAVSFMLVLLAVGAGLVVSRISFSPYISYTGKLCAFAILRAIANN